MLIGSTRLLRGQLRDPMIGRDVLIGVLFGSASWVFRNSLWLLFDWAGWASSPPRNVLGSGSFDTPAGILTAFAGPTTTAVSWAMSWAALLVLFRLALRHDRAAAIVLVLILASPGVLVSDPAFKAAAFVVAPLLVWVLYRFGVFAIAAALAVRLILYDAPLTLDLSAWYASRAIVTLLVLLALAAWGFHVSLGGKPAFGTAMMDEEEMPAG
jgi:hypothetical protein